MSSARRDVGGGLPEFLRHSVDHWIPVRHPELHAGKARRGGGMIRYGLEKLGTGVGSGMVRAGETGTGSWGDWRISMLTGRFGIPKNGGYTRGDWWRYSVTIFWRSRSSVQLTPDGERESQIAGFMTLFPAFPLYLYPRTLSTHVTYWSCLPLQGCLIFFLHTLRNSEVSWRWMSLCLSLVFNCQSLRYTEAKDYFI